jgi:hypothetical protein
VISACPLRDLTPEIIGRWQADRLAAGAALTMKTYGHVIDELEDAPRIAAEDAIMAARPGTFFSAPGRIRTCGQRITREPRSVSQGAPLSPSAPFWGYRR